MAKISNIEIPSLLFEDQASTPTTPAAGLSRVFTKADGLYVVDDAGTVTGPFVESAGSAPGNLWAMNKSTSQTLTSNTLTQITFDNALIDGGGSVIDLANERFVAPATGKYMVNCSWLWETTAPLLTGNISVKVGATESITLVRLGAATYGSNGGLSGGGPLSLTSGDFVTMWIHPGGAVTPTARGNASVHLSTAFTLVRIT